VDSAWEQKKLEATIFPPPNTISNSFIPSNQVGVFGGGVRRTEGAVHIILVLVQDALLGNLYERKTLQLKKTPPPTYLPFTQNLIFGND
jgi:hypothetical protein